MAVSAARQREQSHPTGPEQGQRIEVHSAATQPPVQAGGDRAARMAGLQRPERSAGGHRLAGAHLRHDRLVRGPQPARVVDADHPATGHPAGEVHDSGPGGEHARARLGGEVDAAVAGQPRRGRRSEPPDHRRPAVQRPAEPGGGAHRRPARSRPRLDTRAGDDAVAERRTGSGAGSGQGRPHPAQQPEHRNQGGDQRHETDGVNGHARQLGTTGSARATTTRPACGQRGCLWTGMRGSE